MHEILLQKKVRALLQVPGCKAVKSWDDSIEILGDKGAL
jgi:hypothetical protein